MAFVPPLHPASARRLAAPRCRRRTRMCAAPGGALRSESTSRTFGEDAGRDLFFTGMGEALAIATLDRPREKLKSPDDRYIAAERLKFFITEQSTLALMRFISRVDYNVPVEERAARRKAVESLGRHAGKHCVAQVRRLLVSLLDDADPNAVENAVWALSQLVADEHTSNAIAALLKRKDAPHRVVLHALTDLRAASAVGAIRDFHPSHPAAHSAAAAAIAVITHDHSAIAEIPKLLKSTDLNLRRAAIYDLAAARYAPALHAIARAPLSLVLRMRAARAVLRDEVAPHGVLLVDIARTLDQMMWDHPYDLDLLGRTRDTPRQRDPVRNVRALYRNDALDAYVATRTLCEDKAESAGDLALRSHTERAYFDYFGAYHAFKTVGWLRYLPARDALLENARTLPPRFFNHRIGALLALANLGRAAAAVDVVRDAATEGQALWQLKYACLIAAERLGDHSLRLSLVKDPDWLVRARAAQPLGFQHLRTEF